MECVLGMKIAAEAVSHTVQKLYIPLLYRCRSVDIRLENLTFIEENCREANP